MRMREIQNMERMKKHRAERKRIFNLIHDFCGTEMKGKGCGNCPIDCLKVCNGSEGLLNVPVSSLRKAEETIKAVKQ